MFAPLKNPENYRQDFLLTDNKTKDFFVFILKHAELNYVEHLVY